MRLMRVLLALGIAGTIATNAHSGAPALDPEAHFNIGMSHLRGGRLDMAIESLRAAIKGDGNNPYFYKALGAAYAGKREWGKAVDAFRKALEINPYYADVHNDLGSALSLAGKRDEARQEFLLAFNDPTYPNPEMAARNLGQLYFEEKNLPEAQNWFKTAIQRNKQYGDAYLGLAQVLQTLGRTDEAIAELEVAHKELPDSPAVLLALGEACQSAGRFNEARANYEKVARMDPGGPTGRRALDRIKQLRK